MTDRDARAQLAHVRATLRAMGLTAPDEGRSHDDLVARLEALEGYLLPPEPEDGPGPPMPDEATPAPPGPERPRAQPVEPALAPLLRHLGGGWARRIGGFSVAVDFRPEDADTR